MAYLVAVLVWLLALALLLPAVIGPWGFPEPITSLAREIDSRMTLTFILSGVIFLLSQFALGYAVLRFGRKRKQAVSYVEGSDRWEMLWTTGGAVIFVGLALASYSAWAEARFDAERRGAGNPDRLIVEVVGQQFVWNVRYPGPDGDFGPTDPKLVDDSIGNALGVDRSHPMGDDDLIVPRLGLPVGREVEIVLKSKDVVHNFFVPELRIKLDAVPGLEGRLRFTPDKTGTYEIACSELCGLGHYRMRAFMEVMEPAAFQTWLTAQAQYVQ